jgi:hypothetical protein
VDVSVRGVIDQEDVVNVSDIIDNFVFMSEGGEVCILCVL